jgi:hypothetical protein
MRGRRMERAAGTSRSIGRWIEDFLPYGHTYDDPIPAVDRSAVIDL